MTAGSTLAIEATGLAKSFGATRAVAGIDLAVPAGTIYGVLGPSGAGKTTTIRMLATLLRPDAGRARVFGHDVVAEAAAVRDRISLTGQSVTGSLYHGVSRNSWAFSNHVYPTPLSVTTAAAP